MTRPARRRPEPPAPVPVAQPDAPGGYVSPRERAASARMRAAGNARCPACCDTGRREDGAACAAPGCEAGARVRTTEGSEIDGG